jgi:hypothetical protein
MKAVSVEAMLRGQKLSAELIGRAGKAIQENRQPDRRFAWIVRVQKRSS